MATHHTCDRCGASCGSGLPQRFWELEVGFPTDTSLMTAEQMNAAPATTLEPVKVFIKDVNRKMRDEGPDLCRTCYATILLLIVADLLPADVHGDLPEIDPLRHAKPRRKCDRCAGRATHLAVIQRPLGGQVEVRLCQSCLSEATEPEILLDGILLSSRPL